MKKSQVMATLAAASAMGIVAPLASTVSALTITNNQIGSAAGEASCTELTTAIDYLDGQAGYHWFENLNSANDKYNAGDYKDIVNGANLYINGIEAYTGITFGSTNQYEIDFEKSVKSIASNVVLTDANGVAINQNSIAAVRSMLHAVQSNQFFKAFKPIIDDLNSGADATTLASHVDALKNRSGLPGATNLAYNQNSILADYAAGAAIDTVYGAGAYAYFSTLNNLVNTVSPEYDAAVAGKAAYADLLDASIEGESVLDATNRGVFTAKNVDTNETVVTNLHNLANRASAYAPKTTAWKAIYDGIKTYTTDASGNTIAPCTDNTPVATNFGKVWTLASDYKNATGSSEAIEDVAKTLVGETTVTPIDPTDPTNPGTTPSKPDNKPGNNQSGSTTPSGSANATISGNGNNGVNKNGVPNTGVMISEGASATSTSALSALVATIALAGASWTIFRRNKKNA